MCVYGLKGLGEPQRATGRRRQNKSFPESKRERERELSGPSRPFNRGHIYLFLRVIDDYHGLLLLLSWPFPPLKEQCISHLSSCVTFVFPDASSFFFSVLLKCNTKHTHTQKKRIEKETSVCYYTTSRHRHGKFCFRGKAPNGDCVHSYDPRVDINEIGHVRKTLLPVCLALSSHKHTKISNK